MVTASKGNETGASVAPGKQHHNMVRVQKGMKQEQVWHQVKNTTSGSELIEQLCFGIV